MTTIRSILVPVDFSACSVKAVELAHEMAAKLGATLTLLHVWEVPSFLPTSALLAIGEESLTNLLRERAQSELEHLLAQLRSRSIEVETALTEPGAPSVEILRAIDSGAYDLVVMGTHGRSGLNQLLVGSVAERVVRHAARPVLTVRARSEHEG